MTSATRLGILASLLAVAAAVAPSASAYASPFEVKYCFSSADTCANDSPAHVNGTIDAGVVEVVFCVAANIDNVACVEGLA